jgi:oxaloacetate decarboxylase alpha subunit
MVSPFAQFLITQATLNVVQGERYRMIPDELRKYALGHYGRRAGPLDPDFRERATRGEKEVSQAPAERVAPMLPRLRARRGSRASDDELLLAAYYDDALVDPVLARSEDSVSAVRYRTTPLLELVDYVSRRSDLARVRVAVSGVELALGGGAPHADVSSRAPPPRAAATKDIAP